MLTLADLAAYTEACAIVAEAEATIPLILTGYDQLFHILVWEHETFGPDLDLECLEA